MRGGRRVYELLAPPGCLVVAAGARPGGLLIPGLTPASTSIILARADLLESARAGRHGLALVGEVDAAPRAEDDAAPRLPGVWRGRPGRVGRDEVAEFLGRGLPGRPTAS